MKLGVPEDVIISYHTYRPNSWWHKDNPNRHHRGFDSRDGEMKWLKLAAGNRRLWCTENGYNKNDLQVQVDNLVYELDFAKRHCVEGYTYYQLNDDPQHDEHFGLRDSNFQWKQPLVDAIRNWVNQNA